MTLKTVYVDIQLQNLLRYFSNKPLKELLVEFTLLQNVPQHLTLSKAKIKSVYIASVKLTLTLTVVVQIEQKEYTVFISEL